MRLQTSLSAAGALLVLSNMALAQQTGSSPDTGICAADNPPARREISFILADPGLAAVRQDVGLLGADPSDAQILIDPDDTSVCARLQRFIPKGYKIHGPRSPWVATYFQLREPYVVTVITNFDSDLDLDELTWGQTIILDQDFNKLETVFN